MATRTGGARPAGASRNHSAGRRSAPRRSASPRRRINPDGALGKGGVKGLGVILTVAVIVVITYLVASARERSGGSAPVPAGSLSAEALMEVKNPRGLRQEIIPYTGMTVSFNDDTHEPNWVAWELLGSETSGDAGREPGFMPDPEVEGCATPADYRYSGFDRGHMAPAGDMKWHPQAMRESFYMTNICPQAGDLNRGAWNKLEQKCRARAKSDSALIIICGPMFDKTGPSARIGATGVAVPQGFFKVIFSPYVAEPWAIGFMMPNSYVEGGMQKVAVPVDEVEAATGYDFFSALPDSLENAVEARCDFNAFSHVPRASGKASRNRGRTSRQ